MMRIRNENDDGAITIRSPAHAVFELNSADRNATGAGLDPATYTPASQIYADAQRWNNFSVQKAQPMLDAFARRIGVTEVNFPWYIPNITTYNNSQTIEFLAPSPVTGTYTLVYVPRFYNGSEIVSGLNNFFLNLAGGVVANQQIVAEWDDVLQRIRYIPQIVGGNAVRFRILPAPSATYNDYISKPSFNKTIGIPWSLLNTIIDANPASLYPQKLIGSGTLLRYTDYVDICSQRLHYDQEARDGISNEKTYRDILCRIYCANDTSTNTADPIGTRPFNIHRQFVNPKMLKVNPQQFIPSVDIQILDEYGNLCYIPPPTNSIVAPGIEINTTEVYPDFQLTFIASEN